MDDAVIVLSSDEEPTPQGESTNTTGEANENDGDIRVVYKKLKRTLMSKEAIHSPSGSSKSSVLTAFVNTCYRFNNSLTMQQMVNNKLRKYYSLLKPEYRRSEQFHALIARKEAEIVRCPSHLFRHLKELTEEMRIHRRDKRERMISIPSDSRVRKLCISLESLQSEIKDLEETEVCWGDEENSSYLKLQRYRQRIVKVYVKIQEIEGKPTPLFRREVSFSGTQFPSVNRAIEDFVNIKGEFPNFQDIYNFLKTTYASNGIKVPTDKLKSEAISVFINVGEQLQKHRQYEFWEAHSSLLYESADPANESSELRSALEENRMKYGDRIDNIIDSYAEKSVKLRRKLRDRYSAEANQANEKVEKENESEVVQENSGSGEHVAMEIDEEKELDKKDEEKESDKKDEEKKSDKKDEDCNEAKHEAETGEANLNDIEAENTDEDIIVDDCGSDPGSANYVDVDSWPLPCPESELHPSTTSAIGPSVVNNEFSHVSKNENNQIASVSAWADEESVEARIMRELHVFRDSPPRVTSRNLQRSLHKSCVRKIPEVILVE